MYLSQIPSQGIIEKYDTMATTLGELETQFFAFIQARERSSVETGELVQAFGWSMSRS
jgi:hypothetical protein